MINKTDLLLQIVELRSGLLESEQQGPIETRFARFCDALSAWMRLPNSARDFYSTVILETSFSLAADIEDSVEMDEVQRLASELSLWQAISELGLTKADNRSSQFIANRNSRLEQLLSQTANTPVVHLLYSWTSLLRPRTNHLSKLPGPFTQDASAVSRSLLDLGLPRRARAIANKFQIPLDPLIKWNIDNRPDSEEYSRTTALIAKIAAPSQPVPYRVYVCSRALQRVLSSPLSTIPMIVSTSGHIHIDGSVFGGFVAPQPNNKVQRTRSSHAAS